MHHHYGPRYHEQLRTSGERDLRNHWRVPRKRVLQFATGGAILDIGCSSGGFLRTLRSDAWRLYGIEISSKEARRAEQWSGAQVFAGNILDAQFLPATFDVVTGLHILEHVYQPAEIIGKVREWLKPRGVFYIQLPNIDSLEAYLFRAYWYGLELPRHLYHFSPTSLRRLFLHANYQELFLRTLPDCYVERSMRYIFDDVLLKFGAKAARSPATSHAPGIPWRIVRKAFRLGVLWPFRRLATACGHGAAIEAAFQK